MNKYLLGTILLLFITKAAAQDVAASVVEQSRSVRVADSLFAVGNYSMAISAYTKNNASEEKIARAYAALGNDTKAAFYFRKAIAKEDATDLPRRAKDILNASLTYYTENNMHNRNHVNRIELFN